MSKTIPKNRRCNILIVSAIFFIFIRNQNQRSSLYVSKECFALFQVGFMYPHNAIYKNKIDDYIQLAQQSGLMIKIENDVRWAMQRSESGKLLQVSSSGTLREVIKVDRQLTFADVEGMFILLGIGFLIGTIALISEVVGGITNKCRQILRNSRSSGNSDMEATRNSFTVSQRYDLAKFVADDQEFTFSNNQEFLRNNFDYLDEEVEKDPTTDSLMKGEEIEVKMNLDQVVNEEILKTLNIIDQWIIDHYGEDSLSFKNSIFGDFIN